jgi:hypothetical protein
LVPRLSYRFAGRLFHSSAASSLQLSDSGCASQFADAFG